MQVYTSRVLVAPAVARGVFLILLAPQAGHADPAARGPAAPSSLSEELNGYAGFLGRALQAQEVRRLEAASSSGGPEVRALLAALLYRADPKKHHADLAAHFAVQDYAARDEGRTETITPDEFTSRIRALERAHPALSPSMMMLVSFVAFRDGNLWFRQGEQALSASRFLRGAFLALVFKGSAIDATEVANRLDEEAHRQYRKTAAPKR